MGVPVAGPGPVVLVREAGPGAGKAALETPKEAVVVGEAMAKVDGVMAKVVEVMAVPEASLERGEFPELADK
jgi:hypothetical protein